jgi:type I restriction enzyme R subunit
VLAGRHLNDQRLSMKGIPPKLRAITDQYLASRGIEQKIKPISILDEDFESKVAKRERIKTKAAAVEHAIRHHLDIELDDDPELQASFSEALAAILQEFKDNWQAIYEELEKLRKRIIDAAKEPTYGLRKKKQMLFFRMFKTEIFGAAALDDDQIGQLVDLT